MGKTEIGIKVIKPKTPPPQPAVTPGSQQERAQRQHQSRAPRPAGRGLTGLPPTAGQRPRSPRPQGRGPTPQGRTASHWEKQAPQLCQRHR